MEKEDNTNAKDFSPIENLRESTKVTRKSSDGSTPRTIRLYTEEALQSAVKEVIKQKKSVTEVSQKFSIPVSTLSAHCRSSREKGSAKDVIKSDGHSRSYTPESLQKAVNLVVIGGRNKTDVATEFGIPRATLFDHCHAFRREQIKIEKGGCNYNIEDLQKAVQIVVKDGRNMSEVAKEANIPELTLQEHCDLVKDSSDAVHSEPSLNTSSSKASSAFVDSKIAKRKRPINKHDLIKGKLLRKGKFHDKGKRSRYIKKNVSHQQKDTVKTSIHPKHAGILSADIVVEDSAPESDTDYQALPFLSKVTGKSDEQVDCPHILSDVDEGETSQRQSPAYSDAGKSEKQTSPDPSPEMEEDDDHSFTVDDADVNDVPSEQASPSSQEQSTSGSAQGAVDIKKISSTGSRKPKVVSTRRPKLKLSKPTTMTKKKGVSKAGVTSRTLKAAHAKPDKLPEGDDFLHTTTQGNSDTQKLHNSLVNINTSLRAKSPTASNAKRVVTNTENMSSGEFHCTKCNKSYNSKRTLSMHMRILHYTKSAPSYVSEPTENQRFVKVVQTTEGSEQESTSCVQNPPQAMFASSEKETTRQTVKTSSLKKKLCGSKFNSGKRSVVEERKVKKRHKETNTNGAQSDLTDFNIFICPICPKSFGVESSLITHLRNVHNEKRTPYLYKCPFRECEEKRNFTTGIGLWCHFTKNHMISYDDAHSMSVQVSLNFSFPTFQSNIQGGVKLEIKEEDTDTFTLNPTGSNDVSKTSKETDPIKDVEGLDGKSMLFFMPPIPLHKFMASRSSLPTRKFVQLKSMRVTKKNTSLTRLRSKRTNIPLSKKSKKILAKTKGKGSKAANMEHGVRNNKAIVKKKGTTQKPKMGVQEINNTVHRISTRRHSAPSTAELIKPNTELSLSINTTQPQRSRRKQPSVSPSSSAPLPSPLSTSSLSPNCERRMLRNHIKPTERGCMSAERHVHLSFLGKMAAPTTPAIATPSKAVTTQNDKADSRNVKASSKSKGSANKKCTVSGIANFMRNKRVLLACPLCERSFRHRAILVSHIEMRHREGTQTNTVSTLSKAASSGKSDGPVNIATKHETSKATPSKTVLSTPPPLVEAKKDGRQSSTASSTLTPRSGSAKKQVEATIPQESSAFESTTEETTSMRRLSRRQSSAEDTQSKNNSSPVPPGSVDSAETMSGRRRRVPKKLDPDFIDYRLLCFESETASKVPGEKSAPKGLSMDIQTVGETETSKKIVQDNHAPKTVTIESVSTLQRSRRKSSTEDKRTKDSRSPETSIPQERGASESTTVETTSMRRLSGRQSSAEDSRSKNNSSPVPPGSVDSCETTSGRRRRVPKKLDPDFIDYRLLCFESETASKVPREKSAPKGLSMDIQTVGETETSKKILQDNHAPKTVTIESVSTLQRSRRKSSTEDKRTKDSRSPETSIPQERGASESTTVETTSMRRLSGRQSSAEDSRSKNNSSPVPPGSVDSCETTSGRRRRVPKKLDPDFIDYRLLCFESETASKVPGEKSAPKGLSMDIQTVGETETSKKILQDNHAPKTVTIESVSTLQRSRRKSSTEDKRTKDSRSPETSIPQERGASESTTVETTSMRRLSGRQSSAEDSRSKNNSSPVPPGSVDSCETTSGRRRRVPKKLDPDFIDCRLLCFESETASKVPGEKSAPKGLSMDVQTVGETETAKKILQDNHAPKTVTIELVSTLQRSRRKSSTEDKRTKDSRSPETSIPQERGASESTTVEMTPMRRLSRRQSSAEDSRSKNNSSPVPPGSLDSNETMSGRRRRVPKKLDPDFIDCRLLCFENDNGSDATTTQKTASKGLLLNIHTESQLDTAKILENNHAPKGITTENTSVQDNSSPVNPDSESLQGEDTAEAMTGRRRRMAKKLDPDFIDYRLFRLAPAKKYSVSPRINTIIPMPPPKKTKSILDMSFSSEASSTSTVLDYPISSVKRFSCGFKPSSLWDVDLIGLESDSESNATPKKTAPESLMESKQTESDVIPGTDDHTVNKALLTQNDHVVSPEEEVTGVCFEQPLQTNATSSHAKSGTDILQAGCVPIYSVNYSKYYSCSFEKSLDIDNDPVMSIDNDCGKIERYVAMPTHQPLFEELLSEELIPQSPAAKLKNKSDEVLRNSTEKRRPKSPSFAFEMPTPVRELMRQQFPKTIGSDNSTRVEGTQNKGANIVTSSQALVALGALTPPHQIRAQSEERLRERALSQSTSKQRHSAHLKDKTVRLTKSRSLSEISDTVGVKESEERFPVELCTPSRVLLDQSSYWGTPLMLKDDVTSGATESLHRRQKPGEDVSVNSAKRTLFQIAGLHKKTKKSKYIGVFTNSRERAQSGYHNSVRSRIGAGEVLQRGSFVCKCGARFNHVLQYRRHFRSHRQSAANRSSEQATDNSTTDVKSSTSVKVSPSGISERNRSSLSKMFSLKSRKIKCKDSKSQSVKNPSYTKTAIKKRRVVAKKSTVRRFTLSRLTGMKTITKASSICKIRKPNWMTSSSTGEDKTGENMNTDKHSVSGESGADLQSSVDSTEKVSDTSDQKELPQINGAHPDTPLTNGTQSSSVVESDVDVSCNDKSVSLDEESNQGTELTHTDRHVTADESGSITDDNSSNVPVTDLTNSPSSTPEKIPKRSEAKETELNASNDNDTSTSMNENPLGECVKPKEDDTLRACEVLDSDNSDLLGTTGAEPKKKTRKRRRLSSEASTDSQDSVAKKARLSGIAPASRPKRNAQKILDPDFVHDYYLMKSFWSKPRTCLEGSQKDSPHVSSTKTEQKSSAPVEISSSPEKPRETPSRRSRLSLRKSVEPSETVKGLSKAIKIEVDDSDPYGMANGAQDSNSTKAGRGHNGSLDRVIKWEAVVIGTVVQTKVSNASPKEPTAKQKRSALAEKPKAIETRLNKEKEAKRKVLVGMKQKPDKLKTAKLISKLSHKYIKEKQRRASVGKDKGESHKSKALYTKHNTEALTKSPNSSPKNTSSKEKKLVVPPKSRNETPSKNTKFAPKRRNNSIDDTPEETSKQDGAAVETTPKKRKIERQSAGSPRVVVLDMANKTPVKQLLLGGKLLKNKREGQVLLEIDLDSENSKKKSYDRPLFEYKNTDNHRKLLAKSRLKLGNPKKCTNLACRDRLTRIVCCLLVSSNLNMSREERGFPLFCFSIICCCATTAYQAMASTVLLMISAMLFLRCERTLTGGSWLHLSRDEHACARCVQYFGSRDQLGAVQLMQWSAAWAQQARFTEPTVRLHIVDQHLPFWVECSRCGKWRRAPCNYRLTFTHAAKFNCGGKAQGGSNPCLVSESPEVTAARQKEYRESLTYTPYLKHHPAAPFLLNYAPDQVGMSAVDNAWQTLRERNERHIQERNIIGVCEIENGLDASFGADEDICDNKRKKFPANRKILTPQVADCEEWLQPFLQPGHQPQARAVDPRRMSNLEQRSFPHLAQSSRIYLTIRNLILALWCHFPKDVLTVARCCQYLVCRGLLRVTLAHHVTDILLFLTVHGFVNLGLMHNTPTRGLLPKEYNKYSVLVVGCGIAGVAAARQLANFGTKVTVLEACSRLGGRLCDERSSPTTRDAHTLHGTVNNPVALVSHQCDIAMRRLSAECKLFSCAPGEEGPVNERVDARVSEHFNCLLEALACWRQAAHNTQLTDVALGDKLNELHKQFKEDAQIEFSEEEEAVLQFHLSSLEYACGSSLDHVSALHWDQNELYPQFLGEDVLLEGDGFTSVVRAMTKNLDVRPDTQVTNVNYHGEKVKVSAKQKNKIVTIEADKVIMALPVAILKRAEITFDPPLPETKLKAVEKIGVGIVERVVMDFESDFWSSHLEGADFFGCIPASPSLRGLFDIFQTLPPSKRLVTHLYGAGRESVRDLSDSAIITMCCQKLQTMLDLEKKPVAVRSSASRWYTSPRCGMAYSFLPVDASGETHEQLAQPVADKVYFAGEATNREHPQSATGAFESGLREATRIATSSYTDAVKSVSKVTD